MNNFQTSNSKISSQVSIPPYVPYRTFRTFLEFLQDGIPARIDRSVWGSRFSGSSGTQLMTTFKVLGLMDENGFPTQILEELVFAEGENRRELIKSLLRSYYTPVFQLDLTRATKGQFHEAFRSFGAKEGVLSKCEAFFIQAATDAGIHLSQYIVSGRHLSRRKTGSTRQKQTTTSLTGSATDMRLASDIENTSGISRERLRVAELILSKYPDFDPGWDAEVQLHWLDGMTKLYEGLSEPDA